MIESGEIAPGKLLPSQRTLMQRYEISDGTVKRAVAKLREEGLVETETDRGVYVRERSYGMASGGSMKVRRFLSCRRKTYWHSFSRPEDRTCSRSCARSG